ncbi:MAG: hypothetical protein EPO24_00810 [Bacteroidetes bacterium]|nr:MAG: hypothetical protein EPO24_00810 [Bacteroidota bacterium]
MKQISLPVLVLFMYFAAGDNCVWAQQLPIEKYTVEDGLISNFISAMYQDSRGYLWIGSDDGFSIYDGAVFENYNKETSEFAFRNVFEFLESRLNKGRMWISAEGGVSYVENGKFTNFRLHNRTAEKYVRIVIEDEDGTLWCQDGDYVYGITGAEIRKDTTNKELLTLFYHKSIGDSLVYGLTSDTHTFRMFRVQDGRFAPVPTPNPSRTSIGIPSVDNENNVWIPNPDSSLVRFSTHASARRYSVGSLGKINSVNWDSEGNFWGRFSDGFRKCTLRNDSIHVLQTIPRGLIGREMVLTLIDSENSLWFILLGHGIAKLDHSGFRIEFLLHETTFQSTVDQQGHIWIGLVNGLTEIWRGNQQQWLQKRHNKTSQWPGSHVRTIVFDSLQRMILTYEELNAGLFTIKRSPGDSSNIQFTSTLRKAGIQEEMFGVCDLVDSKRRLWSSKLDTVLICSMEQQPAVLRTITQKDGLPPGLIVTIYEDRESNFWFGYLYEGIYVLPRENILQGNGKGFTEAVGAPVGGIRAFYQDRKGTLWIGTRYDGLYSYANGAFHRYSLSDGLPGIQISSIVEDYEGRLWVQTSKGICFKSDESPVLFHHVPEIVHDEGILFLRNDSLLVLVTSSKVVIFDPHKRFTNTKPPSIYIRNVLVNGALRDISEELEFSHDENNCQIEFAGVSLRDGKAMRYQYKIANLQTNWSQPTLQRTLWLASLQPGDYTIHIRAINPYEIASLTPAVLRFKILLPFWRRWWFLVSSGLIVSGSVFLLFLWRTNRLKREQQIQRESARRLIELQERERKRIAGEIHDSLGQDFLVILNRANMALKANERQKQVQQLQEISSVAEHSIEEARVLAYNLSPYHLEQVGLTAALRSLIENVASTTKISFSHQLDTIDNVLSKEVEVNVFRIIQECVNNIIKHSEAAMASIEIQRYDDSIEIYVRDDGKGFVINSDTTGDIQKGFGLFGLRERLGSIHGEMEIRSSEGKGTALNFSIPIH